MDGVGGGILDRGNCTCLIQAFEKTHNDMDLDDGITMDLEAGGQCVGSGNRNLRSSRQLLYNVIQITGECSRCRRELDSVSGSSSSESSSDSLDESLSSLESTDEPSDEKDETWESFEKTFCQNLKDSCYFFRDVQNCKIEMV